jgi:tripartite-type tricarboxylate transporter receptor subunit TctC
MNKPGAATNIGADYVARAKPDGHVMFVDSATGSQNIAAGKLRAIGIASAGRVKNFEGIPTLGEQGLDGFEAHAWQGVVVPAKTPAHALAALSKALLTALESATVRARLEGLGLEVTPSTPEQMAADATAEREKWGRIIRANNIKLD